MKAGISRRSAFGLAAALSVPVAVAVGPDTALEAYRDVMDRYAAVDAQVTDNSNWHLIEEWNRDEEAAIYGLVDDDPGDLRALLQRLVLTVDRLEEPVEGHIADCEMALFCSLRTRAQEMLARL